MDGLSAFEPLRTLILLFVACRENYKIKCVIVQIQAVYVLA